VVDLLPIDLEKQHSGSTIATITWHVIAAEDLEVRVDATHRKAMAEHFRIINPILHHRNNDPALHMHHRLPLHQRLRNLLTCHRP
jgi:hypothetical protein